MPIGCCRIAFGVVLGWSLLSSAAMARHVLDNGRIHVDFADAATGFTTTNSDRVDSISWINSAGVSTGNLAKAGGPLHCNDPQEYFGQSYGDVVAARPYFVIGGTVSKWIDPTKSRLTAKTSVTSTLSCDNTLDGTATTTYTLSKNAVVVNQLRVVRVFSFSAPEASGTLRVYVPRLPASTFPNVLIPDTNGKIQVINDGACAGNCEVTNWNGRWVADDDGHGNGLMILRNPAKGPSALVVVDNDSFSASNNTSVGLKQPGSGWSGAVSETETLCFYDATSWPASRQSAGQPPLGCRAP